MKYQAVKTNKTKQKKSERIERLSIRQVKEGLKQWILRPCTMFIYLNEQLLSKRRRLFDQKFCCQELFRLRVTLVTLGFYWLQCDLPGAKGFLNRHEFYLQDEASNLLRKHLGRFLCVCV